MNEAHADDRELLRQYLAGSEAAFRELVNRHLGTVQATVRRVLHSAPHLADDVTQVVFTDLAKKAAALPPQVVLAGWLHRHSYYLALNTARAETRRRTRERTAMEITAVNENSLSAEHWRQLAPVLDAALDGLDTVDRDAIVLRYLQQRDLRSVGQAIGLSEDAAQKRVARALEKLRDILGQRGVTVTGVMLATELEASAGPAMVSSGAVATVSAHALGGVATSSALTLLTLKTMTTSKLALALAATVVLVGTTTAIVVHHNVNSTPTPAPAAATPAVKTIAPQIVVAPKVEAPKASPAPAGNAPAGPNDLAAARANSTNSGLNTITVTSGTLALNGNGAGAGAPVAANGQSLQQLKTNLENFKRSSASVIDTAIANANGDPDKLAKVEAAHQQYEQYAEDKQKQIDALEAQAATDGTASTGVGTQGTAQQLQQLKVNLENLKQGFTSALDRDIAAANGDPDKLAKVEANRQQYEKYLESKQKQIDALEAQAATSEQTTSTPGNP